MPVGDIENLTAEFAGEHEQIRKLRSLDPTFEEICSDYDELYRKLVTLKNTVGADLSHASDLRESLTALRCEIQRVLHSPKSTTTQREGPKR
jgi:uncharacterized protein YdcH (DUF465 family)